MRIDLYTRCWNDADMLGFMFRHYDRFVQRYVVFDDGSTDNSLEVLRSSPKVEVRPMPEYSDPDSRIASNLAVLESCWKESRGVADWVIVTDIDEHLHHPDIENYLRICKSHGVTIVPALGYQMMSEKFPREGCLLSDTLTIGAPWFVMNKLNIFSPDEIEATNFDPGRHSAAPEGNVVAPARDELLLLHYKYLGFERTRRRGEQSRSRQRKRDLAMKWGIQYSWSRKQLLKEWTKLAGELVDISHPSLRPWESHKGPRWWNGYRRSVPVDSVRTDRVKPVGVA